ncbi:MAG: ABC transporter ATP-binding protein [Hoeflea sp. BRH_c9]|nr:MAG: ABC transporter ATP-binding protein [Hoeflea sp. BRH_c9]
MAEVRLSGLSKSFGANRAVEDIDLTIADGEFVVLLGPTGAGKTTTLRLIAGLERPDAGSVRIGAEDVTSLAPAERDVAFVFQQYSLYPHLSVFENLAFPLKSPARRWSASEIEARVREIAKMVRIDHKLDSKSTMLSGGEMQRVAIGRALVREPSIFLMDEPLSSLDAKLRADLRLELKRIQSEIGATLLYVTHDQIEAMTMADRIGILAEGRLTQIGSPREIYTAPANLHVAARLGHPHINLFKPGLLPCQSVPEGVKTIGARTEHILVEAVTSAGAANARVDWVEHLGDQNHLHIRVDGQKITLLADPYSGFKAGEPVSVSLKQPLFFGADDRRIANG